MRSFIPLFLIVFLLAACSATIKIPEISSDLSVKKTAENTNIKLISIVKIKNGFFVFDKDGLIYNYLPIEKKLQLKLKSNVKLKKFLFSQNGIIAFQTAEKLKIVIFNTITSKILEIENNREKIIALSGNIYITLSKNNFSVKNIKTGRTHKILRINNIKIFNTQVINNSVIILGRKNLYSYDIKLKKISIIPLQVESSSPFLYSNGSIYFGTADRNLVKFSMRKHKILWEIKLPMKIRKKLGLFGKYIVAIPEDHSIYLFSPRGTLFWWKKLSAEILSPPIPMKNNIAVLVKDIEKEKIVFLNPRRKKIKSVFLENITLKSPLIFSNGYIYSIGIENDNGKNELFKIGNKIGGIVKIDKSAIFEVGKSIKIEVRPVNMINPEIKIRVNDFDGNTIVENTFFSKNSVNLPWIPYMEGKFKIAVTLSDKKYTVKEEEIEINVVNLKKIYKKYFLKLIEICPLN